MGWPCISAPTHQSGAAAGPCGLICCSHGCSCIIREHSLYNWVDPYLTLRLRRCTPLSIQSSKVALKAEVVRISAELLTYNLHFLVCRLVRQEAARGHVGNDIEL